LVWLIDEVRGNYRYRDNNEQAFAHVRLRTNVAPAKHKLAAAPPQIKVKDVEHLRVERVGVRSLGQWRSFPVGE